MFVFPSSYVLVAIVRKRLGLDLELYTILQVLSLSLFEKTPLLQLLTERRLTESTLKNDNQLILI